MGLLRTLLAVSVVFAHSPWNDGFVLVGGRNAVELFYVISGFLIAHILRTNPTYLDPRSFYLNRALRIYPVYFAVAALTLLAFVAGNPRFFEVFDSFGAAARGLLIFSNLFIFGQDWVMFTAQSNGALHFSADFMASDPPVYWGLLIPQAWTLGLELTFYAIAPFVVRSSRTTWTLFGLSIAVCAILHVIGLAGRDPWTYRFFPAELSLFLLGALANVYLLPAWNGLLARTNAPRLPAIATAALALFIVSYFVLPFQDAVKASVLLAVFTLLLPLTFIHQAASARDSAIGELSYPLYIGHMLVILCITPASRALHMTPGAAAVSIANVVLAIAFACVLNLCVGRPVERLRARIRRSERDEVSRFAIANR